MKTQQEIEERIRQIETELVQAVLAGEGNLRPMRKLKTEWMTLMWVTSKEGLTKEDPVYRRMSGLPKNRYPHSMRRNDVGTKN